VLYLKYLSWSLPVIGAVIIASPFPDELGISLMGFSKMKTPYYIKIYQRKMRHAFFIVSHLSHLASGLVQ